MTDFRLDGVPIQLDKLITKTTELLAQEWREDYHIQINAVLVILNRAGVEIRETIK